MPTTAKGFRYPAGSDTRNVPRDIGYLAADIDAYLDTVSGVIYGKLADRPSAASKKRLYAVTGDDTAANNGRLFLEAGTSWVELSLKVVTGTLAARPTTFVGNRIYIVVGDGTATNNGLTFFDTGAAWLQIGGGGSTVRAVAASATDVPVRSTGVASQSGNFYEAVTSGGAVAFAVKATGRVLTPVENYSFTYNGDGSVATAVKTVGGVTVSTTTFAYNSDGTPSTATEVHDGVTDTRTFAYTTANSQTVVNTANAVRS